MDYFVDGTQKKDCLMISLANLLVHIGEPELGSFVFNNYSHHPFSCGTPILPLNTRLIFDMTLGRYAGITSANREGLQVGKNISEVFLPELEERYGKINNPKFVPSICRIIDEEQAGGRILFAKEFEWNAPVLMYTGQNLSILHCVVALEQEGMYIDDGRLVPESGLKFKQTYGITKLTALNPSDDKIGMWSSVRDIIGFFWREIK